MPAPMLPPPHAMQHQQSQQSHEATSPPLRQLPNHRGSNPLNEAGPSSASSWDNMPPTASRSSGSVEPGVYMQPQPQSMPGHPPPPQQAQNFSVPYGQGGYYTGHPGHPGHLQHPTHHTHSTHPTHPRHPSQQAYVHAPPPLDYQLSQFQSQVYEEFQLRLYPLLRQHGDMIRDLDSRLYASETRAAAGLERIKDLEAQVAELRGVPPPIHPQMPHQLIPIPAQISAPLPPPPMSAPAPAPLSASASSSTSVLKRKKTVKSAAASGSSKRASTGKAKQLRDDLSPAVWKEVQDTVEAATQHLYGVPRPYPFWHDLAAGEAWPRLPSEDGVTEGPKAIRFDFDEAITGNRNHTAFRTIVKHIVDNKALHPAGLNMGPGSLVQAKGILLEAAHRHFEELKDTLWQQQK